jgi:hypothetical protein
MTNKNEGLRLRERLVSGLLVFAFLTACNTPFATAEGPQYKNQDLPAELTLEPGGSAFLSTSDFGSTPITLQTFRKGDFSHLEHHIPHIEGNKLLFITLEDEIVGINTQSDGVKESIDGFTSSSVQIVLEHQESITRSADKQLVLQFENGSILMVLYNQNRIQYQNGNYNENALQNNPFTGEGTRIIGDPVIIITNGVVETFYTPDESGEIHGMEVDQGFETIYIHATDPIELVKEVNP